MKIFAVIPCFNSVDKAYVVVNECLKYVDKVICVDDACPLGTGKIIEKKIDNEKLVVFYHKMRFLQTLSNTFANNFFRFEIDPASEIGTLCVAVYPRESHWQRLLTIQKLIISENVTKTFA